MVRPRDVSLRTKLNSLLIAYTVTVAAVMALSGYVLSRYRVGGPVDQEMNEDSQPCLALGGSAVAYVAVRSNGPDWTWCRGSLL